jgi:D-beta-D-heptose 7-phosphate kinase / D-beta-D-heptose 1-phosphate adenosyltransferase
MSSNYLSQSAASSPLFLDADAGLHGASMNASWVTQWKGAKILVLGDVMLDRFIYGRVDRISPEAPIPVLHYQSERVTLGGAGNVARNINSLGGHACLIGAVGDDAEGNLVAGSLLEGDRIKGKFVRTCGYPTTTKVRYVSGGQQIMRLDVEQPVRLSQQDIKTIREWFVEMTYEVAAVVLSDYAKGVLAPDLVRDVIDIARARRIPVVADPKSSDVARYAGATVLTPNASEAAKISGVECLDDRRAELAAKIVRERARVETIVLTRGAQGMTIFNPADPDGEIAHVPTHANEVFDVSGAGDSVVAALALALAAGASARVAARIGNAAAGIAVSKRGTAVVHARELSAALGGARSGDDPKIVDRDAAAQIVRDWKAHGLKVGFTNGCFDLLHPGHVELLRRARSVCDRLVVALNTDASVRRLKGERRPLQNERARSVVMAAIDSVDLVTLFDDDTPIEVIESLMPDYLIKGADYTLATVVGAEFIESCGSKVVLVPLECGHSTTSIIARVTAPVVC